MCDQQGRKLSWETGFEEVGFKVFPERRDRGAISYLEGESVYRLSYCFDDVSAIKNHEIKTMFIITIPKYSIR